MATSPLTAREDQIRSLVVDGLTNDEIAARLRISSRTVEAHLRMLFRKLKVSRRDELVSRRDEVATQPPVDTGRDGVSAESDDKVIRRLEEEIATLKHQVSSYDAVIKRIIDRQFPLFDERVEMTVTIGRHAGEDVVVERHWTDPNPYLVYRVIRPIIPLGEGAADAIMSFAPTCEVVGADVGVAVEVVPDLASRPRALILFQPGLNAPAEWVVRYRMPGLWDPLRDRGEDTLSWAAGTLDGRHPDGINDLKVHFVFPDEATAVDVSEARGVGRIERETATHILYRDETRTGGRYDWRLRMSLARRRREDGP